MGDKLDEALADVANRVGVGTTELFGWLQSDGLEAYGRAQVATYASWVAILLMAFLIGLAMMVLYLRGEGSRRCYCEEMCIVGCIVSLLSAVVLAVIVPELVGWLVSPEGMVMRLVLGR